jgi:hypothetical protein
LKPFLSILFAITLIISLAACSGTSKKSESTKQVTTVSSEPSVSKEPTQEELNAKLKSEAVKADFVKINGGEWKDKKVFAEGEISNVDVQDPVTTFLLAAKEGNGLGVYKIRAVTSLIGKINDKDKVKIYGIVNEPDKDGIPKILVTVIENNL